MNKKKLFNVLIFVLIFSAIIISCKETEENAELSLQEKIDLAVTNTRLGVETEIGKTVYFKDIGNDLRWRVIITPLSRTEHEVKNSSKIDSINLTYWYER